MLVSRRTLPAFALLAICSSTAYAQQPSLRLWRDLDGVGESMLFGTEKTPPAPVEQVVTLNKHWSKEVSGINIISPNTWVTFYGRDGLQLHLSTGRYDNLRRVKREKIDEMKIIGLPNWNDEALAFRVRIHRPDDENGTFCTASVVNKKWVSKCKIVYQLDVPANSHPANPATPGRTVPGTPPTSEPPETGLHPNTGVEVCRVTGKGHDATGIAVYEETSSGGPGLRHFKKDLTSADTLTVRTSSGRIVFYYRNPGSPTWSGPNAGFCRGDAVVPIG